MDDDVLSQRIVPQGGLNTLDNYLTLSMENPGAATVLQNFESSLSGGYRRINGYEIFDANFEVVGGAGAEGAILCIVSFYNTAEAEQQYIAARKTTGADNYKFYLYDDTTGWGAIATGITHDMTSATQTVTRVRYEVFNHGTGNQIIFVDGVNPAVVFDGTNWYSLTSAGTGGSGSPGGNQILDAPSVVTAFKRHLFLAGDESFPGVVCHSAPEDALTWTAAAGGGQLTIGFDVVQIKPFRDECFIFGKTAIKKALPDPAAGFITFDVTTDLGCLARDSVVEIGGNLIFLSHDGIRPIAGTDRNEDVELGLLSQDIQDLIDELENTNDLNDLTTVVIRDKTQFRYFYSPSTTDVEEAIGLIGCVRRRPQVGGQSQNRWEFSTLLGIRANCTWSGTVDTNEVVLHGDYDGVVYRQETGNSFDGRNIEAVYSTAYLDMGDTTIRKTLRNISTFIKAEGNMDCSVNLKFDWGDPNAITPAAYSVSVTSGITYDDPNYHYDDADAVYAGMTTSVLHNNIQGSCYSVQYTFSSQDTSAPYTILGFVQQFTSRGRQ